MSIADPATAAPRTDLPFLRHRSRRGAAGHAVVPPSVAPDATSAVSAFVHGEATHHHAPPPAAAAPVEPAAAAPPAPPAPPVRPPADANLLDLSAPAPPAPPPAAPAPPVRPPADASLLDLSAPAAPAQPPAPAPSTAPARPPASVPPAAAPAPVAPSAARYAPRRARPGAPSVLSPKDPVVTLTRIQSGVGVLSVEAACSPSVGDVRLGCAYQLRSGLSSVVQPASGVTTAPPASSRPVIIGDRGRYERLRIDLVQSRDLARLIVYLFSEGGGQLEWGGTLVVTTLGQARMEVPLGRPPSAAVCIALSLYNIDGEFVLRAENEEIPGTVRDAVTAYGFDHVAWLDARTPLV